MQLVRHLKRWMDGLGGHFWRWLELLDGMGFGIIEEAFAYKGVTEMYIMDGCLLGFSTFGTQCSVASGNCE